jgi:hypothetical protein
MDTKNALKLDLHPKEGENFFYLDIFSGFKLI